MKQIAILAIGFVITGTSVLAAEPTGRSGVPEVEVYRDQRGHVTGTSTAYGNVKTYRDAKGHTTMTETTYGNTTTARDSRGHVVYTKENRNAGSGYSGNRK